MAETPFGQVLDQVRDLLEAGDIDALRALVAPYQASEIAEDLELLTPDEQVALLRRLPEDFATDIIEYLDEAHQVELLERFRPAHQAAVLREMEPDERADFFQALPEELADKFLDMLPRAEKEEVRELVAYGPDTAGGRMTPEFAWVLPEMTVADAIAKFRQTYADFEMVYYMYVLDGQQRLVGLLSIRQLLLHEPGERVQDIMFKHVVSVKPNTDQEEVAQILTLYDFLALPVVDDWNRMLGIVTFDDVADVMSEEAGEDLERFGALLPSEQSYDRSSIWDHIRRRVPWLAFLLLVSSISGFIIRFAEQAYFGIGTDAGATRSATESLMLFTLLFALYPMLTGAAGNAGTQAATVMIRGMASGEIGPGDRWRALRKELLIGLLMGILLAVLGFVRAMLGADRSHWLFLGASVGVALIAMLLIANLMGALLPLLSERLGFDPAVMSGPLIATLTDILSATVYFSIAALIASYML